MKKTPLLLLLLVIVLVGAGVFVLFKDTAGPTVQVTPEAAYASRSVELTLALADPSGLRSLKVGARREGASHVLLESSFDGNPTQHTVGVSFANLNFPDGSFQVEATATDASWALLGKGNSTTEQWNLQFDSLPPRASVKSPQPYVRRGGTGSVRYTLNEPARETGIQIQELFYPAYVQENGDYLAFFPYPHILPPADYTPDLVATDLAGNTLRSRLPIHALDRAFKQDKITLGDAFLSAKSMEFVADVPGDMSPLERYLKVNSEVRTRNEAFLPTLAADTSPTMLWEGAFIQLPNGASRAGFADHRTYYYNTTEVDQQYHMGLDLASVKHAPVPAGNAGRVVFADMLGIFGNLVVIDHGLGLQSLYSHLSEISVNTGDVVKTGDIIGKTGVTGLAGGDHLHFGITVGGVQVQPLEWLDNKWIRDNVTSRVLP